MKEINQEIYDMIDTDVLLAHNRYPLKLDKTIIFKRNGYFADDNHDGFSKDVLVKGLWEAGP